MKYNYHVPVSAYTRSSQYTPTYPSATYSTSSHYTPTHYTSAYSSATKYTPAQCTTTHYTPSQYTSTYKAASVYLPSRYGSSQRTQAQVNPAPVIPVAPAKRSVHFPNDIIFQDNVRRGDLEQIGRFMRARKVRVDTVFHSGELSTPPVCFTVLHPCSMLHGCVLQCCCTGLMWPCVQVWQPSMKLC